MSSRKLASHCKDLYKRKLCERYKNAPFLCSRITTLEHICVLSNIKEGIDLMTFSKKWLIIDLTLHPQFQVNSLSR